MTGKSLAAAVGVSAATVSQIENGRTALTLTRLSQISDVLGLGMGELLAVAPESAATDTASPPPDDPARIPDWRAYAPLEFDEVLKAAVADFAAVGYHGSTVRGIAARADLSIASIYHRYPSKQSILMTIMRAAMHELLERADLALAESSEPVKRFALLLENLALFHTHRRGLMLVGGLEQRSLDGVNRTEIGKLRTRLQGMFEREAEAAVAQEQFHADRFRERTRAVVTMVTSIPIWLHPGGSSTAERVAADYVDFALDLMTA